MNESKQAARMLVVDLDDTLWAWFDPWYRSFRALLDEVERISGIDEPTLTRAIRRIHQRQGTTEYSWLLDDLPELAAGLPPGESVSSYYDSALHAQNSARRKATRLYPGVKQTLQDLRAQGVPVVAYTESLAFWTRWHIKATGLEGLLSQIYSSPDHDAPAAVDPLLRRTLPEADYRLDGLVHHEVPRGTVKPNPAVLHTIIEDAGLDASATEYVGDSLMKDVAMAQAVGAHDAWAKYGTPVQDARYGLLQAVSHWPDAAIAKEQDRGPDVHPKPSITLRNDFSELLDHIAFQPARARVSA